MQSSLKGSNQTTASGYWARRLGACAAVGLGVAGVLTAPTTARAQAAEAAACGAATAAAIGAKWAAEQAFAARDALATISMNLRNAGGAVAAAAAAEADAANANLTSAFAAAKAAREAASSACSAAYAAIVSSGVEKRGAMGMSYCSPITTLGGPPLALGENPLGDGRFFEYLYGYPLIDFARGISPLQQPVHVVVRNCRNNNPAEILTVTPPPPDSQGTCPAGSFWSGSSLVGCRPCLPTFGGFRGCPFPPPSSQISAVNPPTVTGPSSTTTITHGPGTTLISRVPRTPMPPLVALLPPVGPGKSGKPLPGNNPCASSHHHACNPGTGTVNSGAIPPHGPGKLGTGAVNSGISSKPGMSTAALNPLGGHKMDPHAGNRKSNKGFTTPRNRHIAGANNRLMKSASARNNNNSFARHNGRPVRLASVGHHNAARFANTAKRRR